MKSAWPALGLVCGSALALAPLRAADKAADADLLEYLGSVDSSEAGWHDYLAATEQYQRALSDAAPDARGTYALALARFHIDIALER